MLNENDILYDEAPELTAEVEQLNSTLQLNKEERSFLSKQVFKIIRK